MPEIGAALRETRIRAGLEISDIEASTKIRAKYLRAIENEEWGLLPGPTFVKSFLRTYAETLGLDARLILEEYKLRYERFDDQEAGRGMAIGGATEPGRMRQPRGGGGGGGPRWWLILLIVVVVGVAAYLLLSGGSDDASKTGTSTVERVTTSSDGPSTTRTTARTRRAARRVRLQILPTAPVSACLVADGRKVLTGQVLQPGSPPGTFTARRMRVTLSNGTARLRIDGRTGAAAGGTKPVGYAISASGRTRLKSADLPTCG